MFIVIFPPLPFILETLQKAKMFHQSYHVYMSIMHCVKIGTPGYPKIEVMLYTYESGANMSKSGFYLMDYNG